MTTSQTTRPRLPDDKADIISCDYEEHGTHAIGVQILHPKYADLERYAIIFSTTDTRESVARKFRRLADSLETGEGAVIGEEIILSGGNELNADEYPQLRRKPL